jgi:hypothetical protein
MSYPVSKESGTTHVSHVLSPKEGLPNPLFSMKLEKPFTKEGPVLDLKVMNPKYFFVFRATNHTLLNRSIFFFSPYHLSKRILIGNNPVFLRLLL